MSRHDIQPGQSLSSQPVGKQQILQDIVDLLSFFFWLIVFMSSYRNIWSSLCLWTNILQATLKPGAPPALLVKTQFSPTMLEQRSPACQSCPLTPMGQPLKNVETSFSFRHFLCSLPQGVGLVPTFPEMKLMNTYPLRGELRDAAGLVRSYGLLLQLFPSSWWHWCFAGHFVLTSDGLLQCLGGKGYTYFTLGIPVFGLKNQRDGQSLGQLLFSKVISFFLENINVSFF